MISGEQTIALEAVFTKHGWSKGWADLNVHESRQGELSQGNHLPAVSSCEQTRASGQQQELWVKTTMLAVPVKTCCDLRWPPVTSAGLRTLRTTDLASEGKTLSLHIPFIQDWMQGNT